MEFRSSFAATLLIIQSLVENMGLELAYIWLSFTFLCLFYFLDILLRHSLCSAFPTIGKDDSRNLVRITHIPTSKYLLSHLQDTSNKDRSSTADGTLKSYFFQKFTRTYTSVIYVFLRELPSILNSCQNHKASPSHFELLKYSKLLHPDELFLSHAFLLTLL